MSLLATASLANHPYSDDSDELKEREYSYKPLQPRHIWLLQIHHETSTFHIVHKSVDFGLPYSAIPYTWNGETPTELLLLEDGFVRVTPNIEAALPKLISWERTSNLW